MFGVVSCAVVIYLVQRQSKSKSFTLKHIDNQSSFRSYPTHTERVELKDRAASETSIVDIGTPTRSYDQTYILTRKTLDNFLYANTQGRESEQRTIQEHVP